jgi:YD repeat-containing protein
VSSDYDARGNRTRITHPDGKTFEYAYNMAGQIVTSSRTNEAYEFPLTPSVKSTTHGWDADCQAPSGRDFNSALPVGPSSVTLRASR